MSTIEHPKFIDTSFKGPEYQTQLTTYDLVSTSPSKLKYTFGVSKNPRFKKPVLKGHEQIGDDLPSTLGKKSSSFGIGERFAQERNLLKKSKPILFRSNLITIYRHKSIA